MLPGLGCRGGEAATTYNRVLEESLMVQGNVLYEVLWLKKRTWRESTCWGQRKVLEENNQNIITSYFSIFQTFCKEHM